MMADGSQAPMSGFWPRALAQCQLGRPAVFALLSLLEEENTCVVLLVRLGNRDFPPSIISTAEQLKSRGSSHMNELEMIHLTGTKTLPLGLRSLFFFYMEPVPVTSFKRTPQVL